MPSGELLTKAKVIAGQAIDAAKEGAAALPAAQQWILDRFGETGLYAAYVIGAALGLFLILQVIRITFATLKYLVVPGVGLALLGSLVLPYSFIFLLPITVAACSLLLLIKG